MAGCSVNPVPLTGAEIEDQARSDKSRLTADQEPLNGPVTLYEAMARALSYNLDLRLELIKKHLAVQQLDVARYEQMPELIGTLGYDDRSNYGGASSRSLTTGLETLEASTSSEKDLFGSDLYLSWNMLDFGVSYYRAQQAADRVLISAEQKRKVVNQILQDTRIAYWRAATADRLQSGLDALVARVDKALIDSRSIERERLDNPLKALKYQLELIDTRRKLQLLYKNMSLAKVELGRLMNVAPGSQYDLDSVARTRGLPALKFHPDLLEQLALENRAELREIAYERRINALETKAALLELLPGIHLNLGGNYDSNQFLYNNNWRSYGALVSWNLLNILKYPVRERESEARDQVIDAQRLALSMAILSQVHVGLAQYEYARTLYGTAADYKDTQRRIVGHLQRAASADAVDRQELIREEMNSLLAEVRYDVAYADLEYAYANTYAAIGMDAVPDEIDFESLDATTRSLKVHFENLERQIGSEMSNATPAAQGPVL